MDKPAVIVRVRMPRTGDKDDARAMQVIGNALADLYAAQAYEKRSDSPYNHSPYTAYHFTLDVAYEVEPPPQPKRPEASLRPIGGGWYELPDGRKVQGKERALSKMES